MVAEAVGNARRHPHRHGAGFAGVVLAALAVACSGGAPEGSTSAPAPAQAARADHGARRPARAIEVARTVIGAAGVAGLSDLTTDDDGHMWAVAEKTRVLVRMQPDGGAARVIPLDGVPAGLDVEGMAWLAGDRLALATEADDPQRESDRVLFARLVDGGARVAVDRELPLDYARWPLRPNGNQGIEGLCRAGRALVAAVESVSDSGVRRLAPVAVHDMDRGGWTPYLVRLTTATGKLSALACRTGAPAGATAGAGPGIDVLAVERHFEVAHLIRFELPALGARTAAPITTPGGRQPPPPVEIAAVVVADLAPLLKHRENFEGLVWDGRRAIALVVDNDWAGVTGPNLLVRARLSGPVPEPTPALPSASRPAHRFR